MNASIPLTILFADPERTLVRMSWDGKWISYLAPYQGILNIWVSPLADPQAAKRVTQVEQPIKNYWWSTDNQRLLFIFDHFGDENWQLHGVDLATQQVICYTPRGKQAKILKISHNYPDQILLTLNERNLYYHDVYRLDLTTGALTGIYQNEQYWEFIASDDFNTLIGIQVHEKHGSYWDVKTLPPRLLSEISQHDLLNLYFYPSLKLDSPQDDKKLYLLKTEEDTAALVLINLADLSHAILARHEKADICDILIEPQTSCPLAYAVNYERKKWYVLDPAYQKDFEYLSSLDEGDFNILSQDKDNQQWLVEYIHDNKATTYYHYQRLATKANYLFVDRNQLSPYALSKMYPKIIPTRDGLNCVSYLSLPPDQETATGVPKNPLPLVLWVHGGPNFRDFWGFNPLHQWLTNRGWAVLSVNYRSSTGFGKKHALAGNGEWGRKIQTDLIDAVQWACEQGIALKDKIAIMGRSFGGYATLMGLCLSPEIFCCGVDMMGPANLNTLIKHFPPYWKTRQLALQELLGCNPNTPEGEQLLAKRSPLTYATHITKPLLIAHGDNDVQVLRSESDQIVDILKTNHIPVTYVVFPDEGHQITRAGNRMIFYRLIESFLAKATGIPSESFATEFEASSMIVKQDDFGLMKELNH